LEHWRQLNLAPAFVRFAQIVDPLSASMPLLLHNWREIVDIWIGASESSDDEGLCALLECASRILLLPLHVLKIVNQLTTEDGS